MKLKNLLKSALFLSAASMISIGANAQNQSAFWTKHNNSLTKYIKNFDANKGYFHSNTQSLQLQQRSSEKKSHFNAYSLKKHDGVMFQPRDSAFFYWGNHQAPENYEWEMLESMDYYNTMYYKMLNDPLSVIVPFSIYLYPPLKTGDSVVVYNNWDDILSKYSQVENYTLTLDNNGKVSEVLILFDDSIPAGKYTYTYNAAGETTSFTVQDWDGVVWENVFRIVANYDSNNNLTELNFEGWNLSSSSWKESEKYMYNYDAQGDLTTLISQEWNDVTTNWENESRFVFSYTNGVYDNFIIQYWDGVIWDSENKFEITGRNAQGEVTGALIYEWDGVLWGNGAKITFTFDSTKYTGFIAEEWDGVMWKYELKREFAYDGDKLKSITIFYWDDVLSRMENEDRVVYEYGDNGKVSSATRQEWDGVIWQPSGWGHDKMYLYYEEVDDGVDSNSGIRENAAIQNLVVYPNPTKDQLNVKVNSGTIHHIQIVDVTGKVVFTSQDAFRTQEVNIPTAQLSEGVYFLKVNNNITKSFVVQR